MNQNKQIHRNSYLNIPINLTSTGTTWTPGDCGKKRVVHKIFAIKSKTGKKTNYILTSFVYVKGIEPGNTGSALL